MQREKAEKIQKLAKVVAGLTSPRYLYDDVVSVVVLRGLEILYNKPDASDGYLFVSMKRAAIRYIKQERERNQFEYETDVKVDAGNQFETVLIKQRLAIFYKATYGMTKTQLKFLYHFVIALEGGDYASPLAYASKECGFSSPRGSAILKILKDRVNEIERKNDASGLRTVQNIRDMRKLLYKRSRVR